MWIKFYNLQVGFNIRIKKFTNLLIIKIFDKKRTSIEEKDIKI